MPIDAPMPMPNPPTIPPITVPIPGIILKPKMAIINVAPIPPEITPHNIPKLLYNISKKEVSNFPKLKSIFTSKFSFVDL